MKRFVGTDWGVVGVITVATLAVAGVTGAGEDGTFLIAVGFLAIAIIRGRVQGSL